MSMAANGFASNSDFQSSTLSQERTPSPFSKITSYSGMLFSKVLSETTSPIDFGAFANAFSFSLRSSRPTFPHRSPSKRWEFSEVAGLKAAMSITMYNEPEKSMGGNLVLRSSLKFNIPNSTHHLGGGSMKTRSSSVIFSIGDVDDHEIDYKDPMELEHCGNGEDSGNISISPPMSRQSSSALSVVGDDDNDPIELDHFGGYPRSIPPSLPVPVMPFSHTRETQTFIYGSGSSGQENMSRVTCSPIKGKVVIPEGQLIKEQSVLPVLIDPGCGFMAFDPAKDMEKFEEYTCITTHGPNPKKTHIFCDYIFERHPSESPKSDVENEQNKEDKTDNGVDFVYPSSRFLTSCYGCRKELDHMKDIYMYRSDRAFCSEECREDEILWDEKIMKMKKGKVASTSQSPHG
ncbi:hypothetical protein Ancab_029473 [Ancistrocladus abbreviatus]